MDQSPKKILIVAAEDSSCLYAERLMEHWQKKEYSFEAFGVGSQKMQDLGFHCIGRSDELAVMGLQEVAKHWKLIKQTFINILEACDKEKPDIAILLDYPGFNLKMAKKLKERGIKVVYYISPKIWAWKKGRVKLVKKYIDKMIVLFPFEIDFYKSHNYHVDFLGHPILDEVSPKFSDPDYVARSRARYGVKQNEHVVALMPGSRKAEVEHHLHIQMQVAEKLYIKNDNLKFMLFVAPGFKKETLQKRLPNYKIPLIIVKDDPFEMISLADSVLAASGTATLFVGLLKKPMVIMYIMKPITAFLAKLIVRSTPYFGITNLILEEEASIELFQEKANVNRLTSEMEKIILEGPYRINQIQKLSQLKNKLGHSGVTEKVAKCIEALV